MKKSCNKTHPYSHIHTSIEKEHEKKVNSWKFFFAPSLYQWNIKSAVRVDLKTTKQNW